jgi:glycolate oxidase FAD binding subunit
MDDLQRKLGEHNQFLPLEVPIPGHATLGGALATKLSGPLRCRYGTARDLILGVRVAHADGTITKGGAKVVKNATAYDMTKLYVGSHGTLGIILEATFRLYPRLEVERGWALTAGDLVAAQGLADRILRSHLVPGRVEILDEAAAEACGISGPGIVVSISGLPETVEGQLADLRGMAGQFDAALTELRDTETTWKALGDFPWRAGSRGGEGPQALWRAGVQPAGCAKAIRAIHEGAGKQAAVAIAATISHGILRGSLQAEAPDLLVQGLVAAREAVVGLGGYLTVLSLPHAMRDGIDVWGTPPEGVDVMRRLKAAFDPKGILNAGRFVGGI